MEFAMSNIGKRFALTDEQVERIDEWKKSHDCTAPPATIGGRITYKFTPTGLGAIEEASCICGAKIDVTDIDSW